MRRSSSLALPCFAAAALFACHSDQTSLTREQLLDPQSCAGCHQDQFQEWEGSMHAYSSNDPVFLAMNKRGQRETNGQLGAFCAYHENTATPTMVFYADMPFDARNPHCQDGNYPNGLVSDGEINGGLSHEHMESVTDPIPNDAWTIGDGDLHGFEIGDVCVYLASPMASYVSGANVAAHGGGEPPSFLSAE